METQRWPRAGHGFRTPLAEPSCRSEPAIPMFSGMHGTFQDPLGKESRAGGQTLPATLRGPRRCGPGRAGHRAAGPEASPTSAPPGADSVTHARTARAAPVPLRVPGQHFCTLHATGARRGAHLTIIRHAKLAFFLLNQLSNRTSRVPGKQEPVTRGRVFCSRAQSAFLVVGRPHCCSADAGAP